MKSDKRIPFVLILSLAVIIVPITIYLVYTVFSDKSTVDAKYIEEQCRTLGNGFPDSKLIVEFKKYETPFNTDNESIDISHSFRFENISGEPLDMNFNILYDSKLDQYIISRMGVFLTEERKLTLKPSEGYLIESQMSLLYPKEKYDDAAKNEIDDLSSRLYFEMILNKEKYYFVLDFNNQIVMTEF